MENFNLVRDLRKTELGRYSDRELAVVVGRYGIGVEDLAGGRRYSMIAAICEWEVASGRWIWELTERVTSLKTRKEVAALRGLVELGLAEGRLSPQVLMLVDYFKIPATWALVKVLLDEGYSQDEVDAAVLTCR